MSYVFNGKDSSSFKIPFTTNATGQTFRGVNATETDANIICDGIASLLACASLTGDYAYAKRTVTEDVDSE